MGNLRGRPNNVGTSMNIVLVFAVLVLSLAAGCSDSTAPDGPGSDIEISFSPVAQGQEVELTETVDFTVNAPLAKNIKVNWKKRGVVIGEGESYTYRPLVLGTDTLIVQAEADGYARNYYWVIKTVAVANTLPGAVIGVEANAGQAPGDVECTWRNVENSTFPITEFVIAMSLTGTITESNWEEARILRTVPNRLGDVYFSENFTVAEDGLTPGTNVWIGVRAIDQAGQISPLANNGYTTVTSAWWVTGVVVDDTGAFPPYVSVRSIDPPLATNTDGTDGNFRLGPFRSIDKVEIITRSSSEQGAGWFDFQSVALDSVTGKDREIMLIKRHVIDPACTESYNGQFLTYLRFMTNVDFQSQKAAGAILWKWDSYPVSVFVPEPQAGDSADFGAAAQFAMAFWDSVMGEDFFVAAANEESADVVFRIDDSNSNLYGKATLLEPAGQEYTLGNVIPQKVEVYIYSGIASLWGAKSVTLHEFGHVLGLIEHSSCQGSEHLMMVGNASNLGAEHPIHPDEQNAVRCIRHLDQGVDFDSFSLH